MAFKALTIMQDIFDSDQHFIGFASSFLVTLGLVLLVLGLSCYIIEWSYCQTQWISFFGGNVDFPQQISTFTMPLAMLAIGFSLRLMTPFGWIVSIMVMGVLSFFFGWLAFHLFQNPEMFSNATTAYQLGSSEKAVVPHVESIIVNLSFCFISLLGILFLVQPPVRKLFWT